MSLDIAAAKKRYCPTCHHPVTVNLLVPANPHAKRRDREYTPVCDNSSRDAALEALEEAKVFRAELVELVDGDDSTLADQIRDLMLNLDEGILRGTKEGE